MLASNRLGSLVEARAIAVATVRVLKQNLVWAFAYNVATIPLAAMGLVPPWLAAIGMSASSLFVVFNAMRIAAPRRRERHVTPMVVAGDAVVTT